MRQRVAAFPQRGADVREARAEGGGDVGGVQVVDPLLRREDLRRLTGAPATTRASGTAAVAAGRGARTGRRVYSVGGSPAQAADASTVKGPWLLFRPIASISTSR